MVNRHLASPSLVAGLNVNLLRIGNLWAKIYTVIAINFIRRIVLFETTFEDRIVITLIVEHAGNPFRVVNEGASVALEASDFCLFL